MDPYENLEEPRGDMPPFHSTSPVNGNPVIRITVAAPSRNAVMNLRTEIGINMLARAAHEALTHLSGYGMLPSKGRYVQVDIDADVLARNCEHPMNRRPG